MTETICSKCGGEVEPKRYTCLWRENNREKYREICRKAQAKFRDNKKEGGGQVVWKFYFCKIYMNICNPPFFGG